MAVRREGKFKNAAVKVENGIKRGLIEGAMLVDQRATQRAPRDTGRLKRSITHGQPYQVGPQRWAIDIGTNVEYAPYQEFGVQAVSSKGTPYTIPAQPYLRPAIWMSENEVTTIMIASVLGALRRV